MSKKELQSKEQELAKLTSELAETRQRKEQLTKELEDLKRQIAQLPVELRKISMDIDAFNSLKAELLKQIPALEKQVKRRRNESE